MPVRPTGSFRRYIVELAPALDDPELYERIREHRFRSIDEQPVAEASVGWVTSGTMASSDFRPESVLFGPVLRLGLRIDRKRLPANAMKVRLSEALQQMGGRVARSARAKLKEEIEKELLGRTVPATALHNVFWRPADRAVLLSTTSQGVHDQFCTLFRETFSVTPEAATPTPLALLRGAPGISRERLLRMAPLEVRQ